MTTRANDPVEDGRRRLFEQLADQECGFCSGGSLVRAQFRGNDAVVCEECGTPAVRLW